MKAHGCGILVLAAALVICVGDVEANKAQIIENFGKIPLSFTINEGQYDPQVKFVTHGSGCDMFFTQEGTTFLLRRETQESAEKRAQQRSVVFTGNPADTPAPEFESFALKVKFLDANPNPVITGENPLPGRANYFRGNDPSQWRTDVSTYEKVRLTNLYDGIDLVYYGNNSSVKYDFVVKPGEDPSRILLTYDIGKNAPVGELSISDKGELVVSTPIGNVVERRPYAYQVINGEKVEVDVWYDIVDNGKNKFSFKVGEYNPEYSLVIDPELAYSTFIGSSGYEESRDIAVDSYGNIYI